MTLPLYMFDAFSRPVGMVIATLIGFAFGFVLERSAFGRAPVLAAQFYGASDLERVPSSAESFEGSVVTLRGGFAAFEAQVLTEPAPPTSATPGALAHYSLRSALHAHFTGAALAAPVEIKPVKVKRARKKEGGC